MGIFPLRFVQVYALDDKLVADGGAYHRACFKCSVCTSQLTTLNFAQLKGVLFCKPHFVERFKLRGSYADVLEAGREGNAATAALAAEAACDAEVASVATPADRSVAAAADVETAPGSETPVDEVVVDGSAAEAAVAALEEVFISGPSVRDRIKANAAAAPAGVAVGTGSASRLPTPDAAVAGPGPSPTPPLAASSASPAASSAAAPRSPIPSPSTFAPRSPAPLKVTATAAPAVAAATAQSPSPASPVKFGGGGAMCAKCALRVYPADPHVAAGADTFHRECFKCTNCE